MNTIIESLLQFFQYTGFANMTYKHAIMIFIGIVFITLFSGLGYFIRYRKLFLEYPSPLGSSSGGTMISVATFSSGMSVTQKV